MTESNTPSKPLRTVRIGAVQAAIWRNEGDKGPFYNVTFERRYRDANEEWQSSHSFGRDDLLVLAKIADEAHTIVCAQQNKDREEQRQASEHNWGQSDTATDDQPHGAEDATDGNASDTNGGATTTTTAARASSRRRSR